MDCPTWWLGLFRDFHVRDAKNHGHLAMIKMGQRSEQTTVSFVNLESLVLHLTKQPFMTGK